MAVKVKKLEWDEIHYNRSAEEPVPELVGYDAESICGYYGLKFEATIDVTLDGFQYYNIGSFDEIDEAMAAAQADFERRILSAIEEE